MKTLRSIKIIQTANLKELGWDDEGEYNTDTKTLKCETVRWSIADPSRLVGQKLTIRGFFWGEQGDFINDMTFNPGDDHHGYTKCTFVGS